MKQLLFALCLALFMCSPVLAGSTWVDGYTRSDGTYVRGHYRSTPDSIKSNNFGRSQNSYQRTNPYARDYDNDGIPNMYDYDSDNDGVMDNYDSNPYSRKNNSYSW